MFKGAVRILRCSMATSNFDEPVISRDKIDTSGVEQLFSVASLVIDFFRKTTTKNYLKEIFNKIYNVFETDVTKLLSVYVEELGNQT